MHFIVHFDRSSSTLLELETFEDGDEAFERLCEIDLKFFGTCIDVILIGAKSEAVLRRLHGEFFAGDESNTIRKISGENLSAEGPSAN
jgi:hypothetical protein